MTGRARGVREGDLVAYVMHWDTVRPGDVVPKFTHPIGRVLTVDGNHVCVKWLRIPAMTGVPATLHVAEIVVVSDESPDKVVLWEKVYVFVSGRQEAFVNGRQEVDVRRNNRNPPLVRSERAPTPKTSRAKPVAERRPKPEVLGGLPNDAWGTTRSCYLELEPMKPMKPVKS